MDSFFYMGSKLLLLHLLMASTNGLTVVSSSVSHLISHLYRAIGKEGGVYCMCLNVSEKKDSSHISAVLCGTNVKTAEAVS